jgi:hypothetical protein
LIAQNKVPDPAIVIVNNHVRYTAGDLNCTLCHLLKLLW